MIGVFVLSKNPSNFCPVTATQPKIVMSTVPPGSAQLMEMLEALTGSKSKVDGGECSPSVSEGARVVLVRQTKSLLAP